MGYEHPIVEVFSLTVGLAAVCLTGILPKIINEAVVTIDGMLFLT